MNLTTRPNPELTGRWWMPDGVESANLPYRIMRRVLHVAMALPWGPRVYNRCYEPTRGGAVYICNHQSFLDPMLMSYSLRRPMSFMARDSLFKVPGFSQLISKFNAFPVKRGSADTGAMKEAMRRIKAGGQMVVFAEGTRTLDGRIGPFLPGVALLAQRAAEWTVPVVIDGAFEVWPRTQRLPSPGHIVVQYAKPIHRDEARRQSPQEFISHVRQIIIEMQTDVRRRMGRPELKYQGAETRGETGKF